MFSVTTTSPEKTLWLGETLGRLLENNTTICLYGDLGAGKTKLCYGIAKGLDIQDNYVPSPTFTLINEYAGRLQLYHIDLYRIDNPIDLEAIGFSEYIGRGGVTLVEWAENAGDALPADCLSVYLSYVDEQKRELGFLAEGQRHKKLLERLRTLLCK
jgi:tRNA threonylcarbamoyladenosine biosynthesis protein TsaE